MIYLIFERIDIKPEAKREKRGERRKIIHRATLTIIPPICDPPPPSVCDLPPERS
jgi:hypothetical protein